MGLANKPKKSKRRPRSDDPDWAPGRSSAVMDVEYDYPHDEQAPPRRVRESTYTPADTPVYSLNNLVESYSKTKTTTVILPDAVEAQLEEPVPVEEELDATTDSDDDDSTLPPPPAPPVTAQDEPSSDAKRQPCPRKYYVGGILLALLCIAAIAVVSLIAPSNSAPSTVASSMADGNGNTVTYSGPPASREEAFTRVLTGISSQESLLSTGSPQNRALDWIVNYDSAQLDPATATQREVQERYILAVFYYSLNGANWFDSFYFLSQNHVCNWRNVDFGMGVSCDDATKTVNGFKFGKSTCVCCC